MVLNEPGEAGWKGRIELPAVNPAGQVLYHPQAPVLGVAPGPVSVVELVAVQNPGPVEEVVDEAVDGDHVRPDLPVVPPGIAVKNRHDNAMWASFGPTLAMVVTFLMKLSRRSLMAPSAGRCPKVLLANV